MNLVLPIELADLPEATKDWILAKAAQMKTTPEEIVRQELDRAADNDGFTPKKVA